MHYLGSVHGVTVSVQHVGRVSDELSTLADELSRKTMTTNQTAAVAMMKAEERVVRGSLISWLSNPETGEELCRKLLDDCWFPVSFAEYFPK